MTTSTAAVLPKVKFESLAAVAQSFIPVTFGLVFLPGALPAGSGLVAGTIPMQVDVKTTHPDGSAQHAVLSGLVPALAANETQSLQLSQGEVHPALASVWPAAFAAEVKLTIAGVVYSAAAAHNDQRTWLDGAVVTETHSVMILQAEDGTKHPHLTARFAVRDYHGTGKVRADVTIENDWAYEPAPKNFTYDVEIAVAGQVVYSKTSLTHLHHARWRKVFWLGAAPQLNIQLDTAYVITSKAFANYDQSSGVSESLLAEIKSRFTGAVTEPMATGLAVPYMPTTGGRDDIGLLPSWAVAYLLSMDVRARDATLGTADLSGSWSSHYRDKKTDRPVSLADYPYMTLVGQHEDTFNPVTKEYEAFPPLVADTTSPNSCDTAHQPSLVYPAYLFTGDYYYLEELQFWAMWNLLSQNPGYRGAEKGLICPEQVRGQAWGLRALGDAAYITPDVDPMKAEFLALLDNNLDWYNATYTNNPNANKLGVIVNGPAIAYEGIGIAPWQDDFFTSAVGQLAARGFAKALPLLQWKAKFVVDRMTSPGTYWADAPMYTLDVRATEDAALYPAYSDAYKATHTPEFNSLLAKDDTTGMDALLGVAQGSMTGYPESNTGFPSNMQPAVAYAVDSGVPNADQAWRLFMSRTVKPDYSSGPQFSIVPRTEVDIAAPIDPTPPTPRGPVMTHKLSITSIAFANQDLAFGTEAATSLLVELLGPDGAVLGKTTTVPGDITGIVFADLTAKHTIRASGINSAGVMGTPALQDFVPQDYLPVVVPPADPVPTTAAFSLPSAVTFTLAAE